MGMMEEIAKIIGGGALDLLPSGPQGVRPDYGLTGSRIEGQRSQYERTLAPGERRTKDDFQSMLADVILSGTPMHLKGTQPRPPRLQEPTSTQLPTRYFHTTTNPEFALDSGRPIHLYKGRKTPGMEGTVHSFQLPQDAKLPLVSDQGVMWNPKRALMQSGLISREEFKSETPAVEL